MLTKPLHPFPARMASELATRGLGDQSEGQRLVLDPMCGSGTVLAEAMRAGHRVVGFDMDPLAVLISACVIRPATSESIVSAGDTVLDLAISLRNGRDPVWPDVETSRFVSYWFDEEVTRDLAALALSIREACLTHTMRRLLWCAFSRMIIVKSNGVSRAMDLSHSRPHRVFGMRVVEPFHRFRREVRIVSERLAAFDQGLSGTPRGIALRADARDIPIGNCMIDCVITSPPYLNAIDYVRMSKFTLIWLGHSVTELRAIRSDSVGSEAGRRADMGSGIPWRSFGRLGDLEMRYRRMIARYTDDLMRVSAEISRVLKMGGSFTMVIGNSAIRGVYVENAEILRWALSTAGLSIESEECRDIPDSRRYLPPPRAQDGRPSRMREEVVIMGKKC